MLHPTKSPQLRSANTSKKPNQAISSEMAAAKNHGRRFGGCGTSAGRSAAAGWLAADDSLRCFGRFGFRAMIQCGNLILNRCLKASSKS
jgi:hypothetical protein